MQMECGILTSKIWWSSSNIHTEFLEVQYYCLWFAQLCIMYILVIIVWSTLLVGNLAPFNTTIILFSVPKYCFTLHASLYKYAGTLVELLKYMMSMQGSWVSNLQIQYPVAPEVLKNVNTGKVAKVIIRIKYVPIVFMCLNFSQWVENLFVILHSIHNVWNSTWQVLYPFVVTE